MGVGRLLPQRLRRRLGIGVPEFYTESYSQEGEDMILRRLFDEKRDGFYVDVGAHHPTRYSNTYMFYKWFGWRGINIDPLPGGMEAFREARPEDINLELAVGERSGVRRYYQFDDPALNGLSRRVADERLGAGIAELRGECEVQTKPLGEILDEHLPRGRSIDFLSVDVEGLDLEVLASNDWERYRPTVVLAEAADEGLDGAPTDDSIGRFMADRGYRLSCRTPHTSIFQLV